MSNQSNQTSRDGRVVLAWIILALQIIGLLWLLLFARDRLAALTVADRGGEVTAVEGTSAVEPTALPAATETAAVDVAATEAANATRTIQDAAATAAAEAVVADAAATAAAESAALEAAALPPEEVAVDSTAVETLSLIHI